MKNKDLTITMAVFVEQWANCGIKNIIISPGSRNTPLSMTFKHNKKFKTYIGIDERSSAFFALGISKSTQNPTILISTSGSAIANYMPAIIEANLARIPLIVITADRPAYLQNRGAPQTINQIDVYGAYVEKSFSLNLPNSSKNYLLNLKKNIIEGYSLSSKKKSIIHYNFPFEEPLIPDLENIDFSYLKKYNFNDNSIKKLLNEANNLRYIEENIKTFMSLVNKKNVILACGMMEEFNTSNIIKFCENNKIPIIADPLSNFRRNDSKFIIESYDTFLKDLDNVPKTDIIIRIGAFPVSKMFQQYVKKFNIKQIIIDEISTNRNHINQTILSIKYNIENFFTLLNKKKLNINKENYLLWKQLNKKTILQLNKVNKLKELYEGKIISIIKGYSNLNIFSSNSMSIRYIDYFYNNAQKQRILCNRGVNGIDGTISTAIGVAISSKNPTVLITGDLAFIHDINGLLFNQNNIVNLTIVLFNNNGGGIFNFLAQYKEPYFDYLFSTPHNLNFKKITQGYNCNYYNINNYDEFKKIFEYSIKNVAVDILEIKTNKERSYQITQNIINGV